MTHLLAKLGWVDFVWDVSPSFPAAQQLLPNSHQPRQNRADSGTAKIQVNPTQVLQEMGHPVEQWDNSNVVFDLALTHCSGAPDISSH